MSLLKKKKSTIIEEKISETEELLKGLTPGTDEFDKTIKSLNELKASRGKDGDEKRATKKSKRESLESIGKIVVQAAGVVAGVYVSLAIYSFDSIGNSSTSKIANFVQQTVLKDKFK